jgi:phosphoenolpyruvate carboxykinase (ATP)
VNTGWTGGPFGTGKRMPLPYTRAMVRAVLTGALENVPLQAEPYFGLRLPERCPEVPTEILDPKRTWEDAAAYDLKARTLAAQFHQNFEQFREKVTAEVAASGPVVGR